MAIKILVNPFEDTTTSPKHELGIIVSDPRGGGQGSKSYQDVLPGEGTGTSGYPTALTIRKPGAGFCPDAEFQYVRNADTDPLIAGSAVMYTLSATDENGAVEFAATTSNLIAGVAVRTIAAGSYGWIQVRGKVPVTSTSTSSDAELRGGVRVATDIATGSFLVISATDGVLTTYTTSTSTLVQLMAILGGKRVYSIDSGINLATSGGTDYRCEAIIF